MKQFIKNKRYLLLVVGILLILISYDIYRTDVNMARVDDKCLLDYGENYEKRRACWNLKFHDLYNLRSRNGVLTGCPGFLLVGLSIYGIYLKKRERG